MPLPALVRNLGKMTAVGLVKPFSEAAESIVRKLNDPALLKRARIHPLAVLIAQKVYPGDDLQRLHPGRPERPRDAGRGRIRHQRSGRHLGLCAGGVTTSRLSAGSRMPEGNTAGGGESFRPQFFTPTPP